MRTLTAGALTAFALIVTPSSAHSWIQQMMVIGSNGSFVGNPGYARNNTPQTTPGFTDFLMVHILPGAGQPSLEERQAPPAASSPPAATSTAFSDTMGVLPTDPMCKRTQQTQFQTNGSPRLQAAPGDNIALRYQENGHVTLPNNQQGKPANRGTVYIYGTTQPKTDEIFLDVFKQWNAAGTGGDKRGVLLATQPFDDGRCYQVNGGNISTARQAEYPHEADEMMGANLWCQNDIALPADAPSGKPYTLYWVWDWPTMPGVDPGLPNGKAEIYTTCMDVDITGTKASRDLEDRQAPAAPAASGAALNNMAIPSYMAQLANPTVQSAQAAQVTSASPMAPTNAAQSATDAQAASGFVSYLDSAISAVIPSASALLACPSAQAPAAAGPVTVTVTAPPVTLYVTPGATPTTMVTLPSPPSNSALAQSPTSNIYMASNPVQSGAPVASPAPVAGSSAPAQAPAQSQPPSVLAFAPPVTSGPPPQPLTSASASSAPAPVVTTAPSVAAQSSVAEQSSVEVPSSVAAPSGAMSIANELSFTGTASAIPVTSTLSSSHSSATSPSAASRGCSMNKCKLKKRSQILFSHASRH